MARECQELCCDECGAEITWTPVVIDGRYYCCHDCAMGLECDCASGDPAWRDDSELLWMGSVESNPDSSYGIDYYGIDS